MTRCNYSIADGPPSRRGPTSTAADFRKLTPIVLMQALDEAGTVVCGPCARVDIEIPTATSGAVLPARARLGATVEPPARQGEISPGGAVLRSARGDDRTRA